MQKKLLIVNHSFPPFDSIASKRWGEMCEFLKESFDVYIFTLNSSGSLTTSLPSDNIKRVGKIQNKNYKPISKAVDRRTSFYKFFNPLKGLRTFDSTVYTFYIKHRKEFKAYFKSINPDVLITSVGPFSTSLFGLEAKLFNKNIVWIVDIRDSMSLYNRDEKKWIKKKVDAFIDKFVITRSDMRFTVSNHLKELLTTFYKKDVITIYNGYKSQMVLKNPLQHSVIYYAGQIYKHQLPSFNLLLQALKNSNYKLIIRLVGTSESREDVLMAINKNYTNNVEIRDPASKEIISAEISQAGNLLVLEDLLEDSIISKGTLTGKLFDYLPYEGKIIAICRKDSEIGDILRTTGRGVLISDDRELSAYLKSDYNSINREIKISELSREAQANRVADLILKFEKYKKI